MKRIALQPPQFVEPVMVISVDLDPALEAKVEQETRRLGISQNEFLKDALERRLGLKNPYQLLRDVRSGTSMGEPTASAATGAGLKARLDAQRSD